jgi:hypothetical protein
MIAASGADLTIFAVVVLVRLIAPLFIFRFPLPAIVVCLVVDAADQTIFQQFTDLDLTSYQGYDKALDVFYLTIAYISTFRNWSHPAGLAVAAFLWYYRLIGVTLFELTDWRPLLLIFPNTFEYFFIFFEIVRTKWNSARLSTKQVVLAAAAIWVFIKLPQEYWIHIAQLDTTDFLKQDVFGVAVTDSWATALTNRPAVTALLLAVIVGLIVLATRLWRRLPPADHPFTVDADKMDAGIAPATSTVNWKAGLLEKIVLIFLVLVIFSEGIPQLSATIPRILLAVVVIVSANAVLGEVLRRNHLFARAWSSVGLAFVATTLLNFGIFLVLQWIVPSDDDGASRGAIALYLLLLSLIITVFDRYHPRRRPSGLRKPQLAEVN